MTTPPEVRACPAAAEAGRSISLCDALDRLLNKGVVVQGDLVISVAGVDLLYVGLRLLLSSVETMREHGIEPFVLPSEKVR